MIVERRVTLAMHGDDELLAALVSHFASWVGESSLPFESGSDTVALSISGIPVAGTPVIRGMSISVEMGYNSTRLVITGDVRGDALEPHAWLWSALSRVLPPSLSRYFRDGYNKQAAAYKRKKYKAQHAAQSNFFD